MSTDPRDVAATYFRAWQARDFDTLASILRDDVTFRGPLGSADLPPTDGLRFTLAERARVVVRPSGTEPKLKCYLEVVEPVPAGADHEAVGHARRAARTRLDEVAADVRSVLGL